MQFIQGILFCQNYPLVHQLLLMSQEELPIDFGVGPWFERIQQIDLPIIRPTSRQKESFSISEATFFPSASVMLRRLYLVRCVMPLKENCTKMTWDYQKRNKKFPFTKYLFHSVAGTTIFFIFFLRRLFSLVPPPFATYQERPQGQRTIINMHASTTKMKSKWLWKYNIATLIQSHHKR